VNRQKGLLLAGAGLGALWLLSRGPAPAVQTAAGVVPVVTKTICKSTRITRADGSQGILPWPVGTVVTLPDMSRATVADC
jgi:hypothetical protein